MLKKRGKDGRDTVEKAEWISVYGSLFDTPKDHFFC